MIKTVTLKFDEKGTPTPTEHLLSPITIVVGPNNSGKSLFLREIDKYCENPNRNTFHILAAASFVEMSDDFVVQTIKSKSRPNPNRLQDEVRYSLYNPTKGERVFQITMKQLLSWKKVLNANYFGHFLTMFISLLGGKERFNLTLDQASGDLKEAPSNTLKALFLDNSKREKVRSLLYDAFKKYFVIDPTSTGQLQIRISETPPPNDEVERGWNDLSIQFHKTADHISKFSDGFNAFTGLTMAAIAGEERVLLIDEPEAFLHPGLAANLGKSLAQIMTERSGNLIASTHSPHFVMGCIQSGRPITIIRLTYERNVATARVLPSDNVRELFRHPLLRSTGTIQALFYSSVIVTESDADRAFYNEINERLLAHKPEFAIENGLFLNAQNHQTIWTIVSPLRKMGIPAAAVLDLDVVQNGGSEFTKLLKACQFADSMHDTLATLRGRVVQIFESAKISLKAKNGIEGLPKHDRETVDSFLNLMAENGVFFVPCGELESWLPELGVESKGPEWLISVFNKMGSDPDDTGYLKPSSNGIWQFNKNISDWLSNPKRKGIN